MQLSAQQARPVNGPANNVLAVKRRAYLVATGPAGGLRP